MVHALRLRRVADDEAKIAHDAPNPFRRQMRSDGIG